MEDYEASNSGMDLTDLAPSAFDRRVLCEGCGAKATRATLHAPDRPGESWRFVYEGVDSGSGPNGNAVPQEEAASLSRAFQEPLTYKGVQLAGLYDEAGYCGECQVPYCFTHWNVSTTGGGRCPRGHFKSLDPHWSPE